MLKLSADNNIYADTILSNGDSNDNDAMEILIKDGKDRKLKT